MVLFVFDVLYIATLLIFLHKTRATHEYDTYLHVFSKNNPQEPVTLLWTDKKKWSQEKAFEKCSIKLIAHGYAERWNMDWRWDWVADLKNEILSNRTKENYCVIAIDWEKGAREVNFITAVANADIAGQHLAEFIDNNNIDAKRLHCIGFSLGAHLCAFASNNYNVIKQKKQKFARITGLDPSGPLLRKASVDKRLSQDDADFVDCIHTSRTFGLQEKSGHMDFFPDGGQSSAKGCEKLIRIHDEEDETTEQRSLVKRFLFGGRKNDDETNDDDQPKKNFVEKLRDQIGRIRPLKKVFLNIHQYIGCNHLRSPHYFIASVNHCSFRAKLCSSWSDYLSNRCKDPHDNDRTYPRMGFYADRSDLIYQRGNGSFYLKTVPQAPYCTGNVTDRSKSKKQIATATKLKKKFPKKKN